MKVSKETLTERTGTTENRSEEEGDIHSQVKQNKGVLQLKVGLSRYIRYLWVKKKANKNPF